MNAVIIGSGPVGSISALYLLQRRHSVTMIDVGDLPDAETDLLKTRIHKMPFDTEIIPDLTVSDIKAAVYIERPNNIPTNSGLKTIPPLKLKPFKTGWLNSIGMPIM